MVEQRFRNPWDRQPGEPSEAYDRFQIYLALGPERSYSDAVRAYLTPSATRKPRSAEVRRKQVRLQEKFASHPEPDRYVNGFATSWLRLAHRWDWLRRADVYDAFQEALAAEKRDLEAQRLAAERQEALARQRKLMEDEAVSLRAQARAILAQILRVIGNQELSQMGVRRVKRVEVRVGPGGARERHEEETKSIFELAPLATAALEVGQRLFRLSSGEASEVTKPQLGAADNALVTLLTDLIERADLPQDKRKIIADGLRRMADDIRRQAGETDQGA